MAADVETVAWWQTEAGKQMEADVDVETVDGYQKSHKFCAHDTNTNFGET